MEIGYRPGEELRRRSLHAKFNGQRQGGISTPAKYPFIFIFTGDKGNLYGYKDKWEGDTFLYTGEGQKGDMEFVRGNKAIRDSGLNGKEIHLFKQKRLGIVEYLGPMIYKGYRFEKGHDIDYHARKLIVFELIAQ